MCLAVPAMLVEVFPGELGLVDAGGVTRKVSLALVEGASPGDYLLVHAGFAIEVIDAGEAEKTLELFRQLEQYR